jgi:nucleotide-binding universal stress UspA family protein
VGGAEPAEKGAAMGVIVVGVDGSEGAAYALEYAAKEAAAHGHRLRLVSAWEIPPAVFTSGVASKEFYEEFEKQAARVAQEAGAWVSKSEPSVECEEVVLEGQAAKALLTSAQGADLLVVGRRGRGTFREMLLGSVSRQVTVHAECPVVVVPPPVEESG